MLKYIIVLILIIFGGLLFINKDKVLSKYSDQNQASVVLTTPTNTIIPVSFHKKTTSTKTCMGTEYPITLDGKTYIGPFNYDAKITFKGNVDDNLKMNGALMGQNCKHSGQMNSYINLPKGKTFKASVVDHWGVEVAIEGTFTVEKEKVFILNASTPNYERGIVNKSGIIEYKPGTVVKVNAIPKKGYKFAYWTGCPSNASMSICTVTMNSDKVIIANFIKETLVCSKVQTESREDAIIRIYQNKNLTPEQKKNQVQDIKDSWLYCGWTF